MKFYIRLDQALVGEDMASDATALTENLVPMAFLGLYSGSSFVGLQSRTCTNNLCAVVLKGYEVLKTEY